MDPEKRARRESRRIIVSEIIMVFAVIIMVAVLALVVSGYWVNSDFKVERQGMLQVSSIPTGASINLDGDTLWLQRTNTSKVLSSGEHTVTLTKDGYDTWSRSVTIREGLLYRLHYPRLFLKDRNQETLQSFPTATFATVSPDRKWLLLANNTTAWSLLSLDRDKPEVAAVNIAGLTANASIASGANTGVFTGTITSANWSADSDHILLQITSDTSPEWLLLTPKNPSASINLTRDFGTNFSEMRIFDSSASKLLALKDGYLRRIDVGSRQVSAVLAEDVKDFDFFESEIIYSAAYHSASSFAFGSEAGAEGFTATTPVIASETTNAPNFYIGYLRNPEATPVLVKYSSTLPQVRLSRFYDDRYLTVVEENSVVLYKRDGSSLIPVFNQTIGFAPDAVKVGHDGEFIFMSLGSNLATLGMEAQALTEWTAGTMHYGWLDNDMIYAVNEGHLSVYDFDGLNHRELATSVSDHFPVTITSDRWLYYFSDNKLVREWLVKR